MSPSSAIVCTFYDHVQVVSRPAVIRIQVRVFLFFLRSYHTYTVKQLSPSKGAPPKSGVENSQKSAATKPRRIVADSDRFKTRVLSKSDFEEIAKCRENGESPQSPEQAELEECGGAVSEGESYHEATKAKIVKPVTRAVKSGIPVVRSKLPPARSKCHSSGRFS